MANAKKTNSTYRTILQNIVCTRHADLSAAYAEIDTAFQASRLTEPERRQLSYMARAHYEFGTGRPELRATTDDSIEPSLEKVGAAAVAHSLACDAFSIDVADPRTEEYKTVMRFAEQKQRELGNAIREVANRN